MIKIIGAILLIGGAAIIGIYASNELSVRARVLQSFLSALDIMRSEIGGRLTPISEILEKLSRESAEPLDVFFRECLEEKNKRRDVPFFLIWSKVLAQADYLKLKSNEKDVIKELGAVLGRYGAEEQINAISHTGRRISSLSESAENDRKRLGKLYTRLGVISGVAVVIILI